MPRYKCIVEYNGTSFHGWQRQDNLPTIEGALTTAIYNFCGEEVKLCTAGRTDAGVHAKGQVFDFFLSKQYPVYTILSALNHHLLPQPIAVIDAEIVADDFSSRFAALKRHYLYRIINRRANLTLDCNLAWHVPVPLDIAKMQQAANHLIGKHDFTSFRDSDCQSKSPIKTIDAIIVAKDGDEITIKVSAKSFLHHMVRNITGTLKLVGAGKLDPDKIPEILTAKNRSAAGPTAPACGLYFMRVEYDTHSVLNCRLGHFDLF